MSDNFPRVRLDGTTDRDRDYVAMAVLADDLAGLSHAARRTARPTKRSPSTTRPPDMPYPNQPVFGASWTARHIRQHYFAGHDLLSSIKLISQSGRVSRDWHTRIQRVPEDQHIKIYQLYQDWAMLHRWYQHRWLYAVHPSLTQELMRTATDDVLSGSVLNLTKHPNVMFTLPVPMPFQHADGQPGQLIAFQVTPSKSLRYATDLDINLGQLPQSASTPVTPERNPDSVHITAVSQVLDDDHQQVIDMDFCHMTMPLRTTFTIDGLVNDILEGFSIDPSMGRVRTSATRAYLTALASVIIPHLLYAVTEEADIGAPRNDAPPARKPKGTSRGAAPKPNRIIPMGFVTGSQLEEYRAENPGSDAGIDPLSGHFTMQDDCVLWVPPVTLGADRNPTMLQIAYHSYL